MEVGEFRSTTTERFQHSEVLCSYYESFYSNSVQHPSQPPTSIIQQVSHPYLISELQLLQMAQNFNSFCQRKMSYRKVTLLVITQYFKRNAKTEQKHKCELIQDTQPTTHRKAR